MKRYLILSYILSWIIIFTVVVVLGMRREKFAEVFTEPIVEDSGKPRDDVLPESALITVPFTPQAPHENWSLPYQEACEEASVIMVHHYLEGSSLSPDTANREILNLVAWQESHDYDLDVTITELASIVQSYYGYTTKISDDVTSESIIQELVQGNPVILPASGRALGNPFFSGEDPFYHMLVVVGYTEKYFITNDPGTKRGEGHRYKKEALLDAIHDWSGSKETVNDGEKMMLVITP